MLKKLTRINLFEQANNFLHEQQMCHNPAILYSIFKRGFIREGYYADLCMVDLNSAYTVNKNNILSKCGWSPLEGTTFKSTVVKTFVNGCLVYNQGVFNNKICSMPLEVQKH